MTPQVSMWVGWLTCLSVIFSLKSGKLHFHAPFGALLSFCSLFLHLVVRQQVKIFEFPIIKKWFKCFGFLQFKCSNIVFFSFTIYPMIFPF